MSHKFLRTCIGCRARDRPAALLRVVLSGSTLLPDPHRKFLGRGAWIHARPDCLAAAERRRAFGRALRSTGAADVGPVGEYVRSLTTA